MARKLPLESELSPCVGFPRPVEAAEIEVAAMARGRTSSHSEQRS